MIKVTIGNATNRKDVIVDEFTTLADVLAANDINTNSTTIHFNGQPLKRDELTKTFVDFTNEESCSLIAVTKLDNAR